MRAFESVARKGTLQEAAGELLVSASAVSHQIRSLELFLGLKLFTRGPEGLTLTPEGAGYAAELSAALDRIDAATQGALGAAADGPVRVQVLASFAQLWLIPRLADFLGSNPDVTVDVRTDTEEQPLDGSDIDLAVVYGDTAPDIAVHDLLVEEEIFPVAGPAWLAENGLSSIDDIGGRCMIGCGLVPEEWGDWLAGASGGARQAPRPQLMFDARAQVLEAAAEGLGLAMNRSPFGEGLMSAGRLAAPFAYRHRTGRCYWLVVPDRAAARPGVKRLRAWFLSQAA